MRINNLEKFLAKIRRGVQFMAIKNDTNAMLLGYREMLSRAQIVL